MPNGKQPKPEMKQVTKPDDVPVGRHFAIIAYSSLTHDDNWGGTCDTLMAEHYVTTDKSLWEAKIAEFEEPNNYREKRPYVAFEVPGLAKVTRQIIVNVNIAP